MRQSPSCLSTALLSSALALALGAAAASPASPCSEQTARQVRFLEGRWSVVDDTGSEIARSTIRRQAGGCALIEQWTAGEAAGVSFLTFDPGTQQWVHVGTSNEGRFVEYRAPAGGEGLQFVGQHGLPDGVQVAARASFEPQSDGSVAHMLELERGGSFETTFQGAYVPLLASDPELTTPRVSERIDEPSRPPTSGGDASGARPVSAVRAATAPEPPPRTEPVRVAPVSQQARLEERSKIEMTSPMVLRIPLGPVEKLPEGYAWSSRDVARYTVDELSIQLLRASQRRKRGQATLAVDLDLVGNNFSHQLDLEVKLLAPDGEEIATAVSAGEKVGRSLSEQIQNGFVRKTLQLEIDSERYAALLQGEERPELEIRVTVR